MSVKARYKKTGEIGSTGEFNTSSISEVVFYADDWMDSVFQKDLEVEIDGKWKDLNQAFKDKDLVIDNLNRYFRPPETDADREAGVLLSTVPGGSL